MSNRITVDVRGVWRLYADPPPASCRMLGTVTRGAETGALAVTDAGVYVMVNTGALRSLDQRKVGAALAEARAGRGGPGRGQGARAADGASGMARYNVSLDAASDTAARELGDGDRSLGIRRAIAHAVASRLRP